MPLMKAISRCGLLLLVCSTISGRTTAAPLITYRLDVPETGRATAVAASRRPAPAIPAADLGEARPYASAGLDPGGDGDRSQAAGLARGAVPTASAPSFPPSGARSPDVANAAQVDLAPQIRAAESGAANYPTTGSSGPQGVNIAATATTVAQGTSAGINRAAVPPPAQVDPRDGTRLHGGGAAAGSLPQPARTLADPSTDATTTAAAPARTSLDPSGAGNTTQAVTPGLASQAPIPPSAQAQAANSAAAPTSTATGPAPTPSATTTQAAGAVAQAVTIPTTTPITGGSTSPASPAPGSSSNGSGASQAPPVSSNTPPSPPVGPASNASASGTMNPSPLSSLAAVAMALNSAGPAIKVPGVATGPGVSGLPSLDASAQALVTGGSLANPAAQLMSSLTLASPLSPSEGAQSLLGVTSETGASNGQLTDPVPAINDLTSAISTVSSIASPLTSPTGTPPPDLSLPPVQVTGQVTGDLTASATGIAASPGGVVLPASIPEPRLLEMLAVFLAIWIIRSLTASHSKGRLGGLLTP